ncbi:MAG: translation elongation factor Ts [Candidatus Cloacimonetes bacterium]|nr:translation elongation factor Ts [Candidatus Cloacimonadota bacterium]
MEITAQMVKELREKTGVGMMDCKKALQATDGNMEEAIKYLREKGISKAATKSDREAKEGRIYAYIHFNNKIGVLVEVNCETDFVARTQDFEDLCKHIAMHIAAAAPIAVSEADIDPQIISQEKEIYYNKAINDGKPENIAVKIADGQVQKYLKQNCLLFQEDYREADRTIQDVINESIAKMGENIQIARFARYSLGE